MAGPVPGRRASPVIDKGPSKLARELYQFAELLRIPEGEHVGDHLRLEDFQRDFLRRAFPADRRVRRAILSIARKNGKTALIAVVVLASILGPLARRNGEILSAARSREQAAMVFRYCVKMIRASRLEPYVTIRETKKEIECGRTGVKYRAVSAEAATAHGAAPFLVIHDELGQVKGPRDDLYDALATALGAYETGALEIIISTQAPTDADLFSLLIDDALTGDDDANACVLYTAPESYDPFEERAWLCANPALGVFRSRTDVERLAEEARRIPSRENTFRNLFLNQRVATESPWLSRGVWLKCAEEPDPAVLRYADVYGGLDLSARQDLSSLVLVAEDDDGVAHVFPYFWTPSETLHERAHRDRAPYDLWRDQGYLTATPGVSIDYGWIAGQIAEVVREFDVISINYDRWRIDELRRELARIGAEHLVPLEKCGQGYMDMTPAVEAIEHAAVAGKLRHGGHPVLSWCVANSVVRQDPSGNRKLDKAQSYGRIDGAVALAMAGKALRVDAQEPGIVRSEGIMWL